MSLDVDLIETKPTSVWSRNITHNLGKMAAHVPLLNGLTLYDIMWRPEEHGFFRAGSLAELLDIGWNILLSDPDYYRTFNPENGWGSYEGLVEFVYNYRNACWDNPEAQVQTCR